MKKISFTLEEHEETGDKLRCIKNALVSLSVKIANGYPNEISDDLVKAVERIDRVRSSLDDLVCKENPELEDDILLRIYF
jgi:hypothetical protein